MKTRIIKAKGVTIRIPTGYFPLIGKFIKGAVCVSDLPKPVILQDEDTGELIKTQLVDVVPFSHGIIPYSYCCLSEGHPPNELVKHKVLQRNEVTEISELAFYLYKIDQDGSNHSDTYPELFEKVPGEIV